MPRSSTEVSDMEGQENGIKWSVVTWTNPVQISILDLNGNLLHSEKYTCVHEPIFGLDIDDERAISKILDKLIKKYGKKEK